jgi:hypothetical protein
VGEAIAVAMLVVLLEADEGEVTVGSRAVD